MDQHGTDGEAPSPLPREDDLPRAECTAESTTVRTRPRPPGDRNPLPSSRTLPARPAPPDRLLGAVLEDTYRIERVLGQGAMGTVYEAMQLRLNNRVAVKVMARWLCGNAEAFARFRREAEVTSALRHPHIVQVFDFGITPTGEPFLVMEYLPGEDLEHCLRRDGRLSTSRTLHIIRQAASALAAAHAKGIVHRDLKPANIYLLEAQGERDFVKILDFGVSKARAGAARLTDGSTLIGTPSYMSREQAQGLAAEADSRTDQWALACIAWEALSGQPPFVADDNLAILYRVIHEEPPPLPGKRRDFPGEVEEVLRRALAKERQHRFSTVNRFAEALERATSTSPRSESRAPWLAAAALAAGWLLFSATLPLLTARAKEPSVTRPYADMTTSASARSGSARRTAKIDVQPLWSYYPTTAAGREQAAGAGPAPALPGTSSGSRAVTRPALAPGKAKLLSPLPARRAVASTASRQTHHGRPGAAALHPPEPDRGRVGEPSEKSHGRQLRGTRRLLRIL